jgi:hypothetical protein
MNSVCRKQEQQDGHRYDPTWNLQIPESEDELRCCKVRGNGNRIIKPIVPRERKSVCIVDEASCERSEATFIGLGEVAITDEDMNIPATGYCVDISPRRSRVI